MTWFWSKRWTVLTLLVLAAVLAATFVTVPAEDAPFVYAVF
jgi:hypothetical protein